MPPPALAPTRPADRVASLDQFRGYTVLGMFAVNFLGGFAAVPWVLKHHDTFCSYADTIMPQFFFAVGCAYRWTIVRRVERDGGRAAYFRVVRRLLGLILVSLVIYTAPRPAEHWAELVERGFWHAIQVPLKRDWFQTLMHIAITSLWVLPVVRASAAVRVAFLLSSAALHVGLSHWFYFAWVNNDQPNGIDGGPLGFLTWTIPMIVGTLCADPFLGPARRLRVLPTTAWAVALMGLGYVLSCGTRFYDVGDMPPQLGSETHATKIAAQPVVPEREAIERAWSEFTAGDRRRLLAEPPFVPPPHPEGQIGASHRLRQWNYWMMSQRGGTLSYLVFSTGLSVALLVLFHRLCDRGNWSRGIFRTLGTNALAGYLLHMLVAEAVKAFIPNDAPAWFLGIGCGLYLLITYSLLRSLEKAGIYIRL